MIQLPCPKAVEKAEEKEIKTSSATLPAAGRAMAAIRKVTDSGPNHKHNNCPKKWEQDNTNTSSGAVQERNSIGAAAAIISNVSRFTALQPNARRMNLGPRPSAVRSRSLSAKTQCLALIITLDDLYEPWVKISDDQYMIDAIPSISQWWARVGVWEWYDR